MDNTGLIVGDGLQITLTLIHETHNNDYNDDLVH